MVDSNVLDHGPLLTKSGNQRSGDCGECALKKHLMIYQATIARYYQLKEGYESVENPDIQDLAPDYDLINKIVGIDSHFIN
jgi:hypothetical protein